MKIPVGAAKCESYNLDEVYLAVRKAIDAAGGLPDIKGKNVLLKPNLLAEAEDGIERGVCTNPAVVYAVGKLVIENGGILHIADSPGGGVPNTPEGVKKTYVGCGIDKIAEELGIRLSYDLGFSQLKYPKGKVIQNFPLINDVFCADIIITLPKLKTHLFTTYTGAVKNQFGLIPGKTKSAFHPMFPNPTSFAEMLIDLNQAVKPVFAIIDAITIMEGDGPSGGQPRKLGYILASPSIYALDAVSQSLIGLTPMDIATTQQAVKQNLLNISDIEIKGDALVPLSDVLMPSTYTNYVHEDSRAWYLNIPSKILLKGKKILSEHSKPPQPYVSLKSCSKCGKCMDNCTSSAISLNDNLISINYRKCIRCNTCFVLCPENAITMLPSHTEIAYRKMVSRYPHVKIESCVTCGRCIRICPMDTISFINKKASIDLQKCIRCYCCHEMCAFDAIDLKDSKLMTGIHKIVK